MRETALSRANLPYVVPEHRCVCQGKFRAKALEHWLPNQTALHWVPEHISQFLHPPFLLSAR